MYRLILTLLIAGAAGAAESNSHIIFNDSWQNGWFEAGTTGDPAQKEIIHTGTTAIEVLMDSQNTIFNCFNTKAVPTDTYTTLSFWVHGSDDGGQVLKVYLRQLDGEKDVATSLQTLKPLVKGAWQKISISLDEFKAKGGTRINSLMFQGDDNATFWLIDDIMLENQVTAPSDIPGKP